MTDIYLSSKPFSTLQPHFLEPKHSLKDLEIWSQCYFRWTPMLEIVSGGFPQIDLFNRLVVNNVHSIQKALIERPLSIKPQFDPMQEQSNESQYSVNSFFPFTSTTGNSSELSDILVVNGSLLGEGSIYDTTSLAC